MIAIVDYGLGNLGSIQNMFKKIGVLDVKITNDPETILQASKAILPGVGAFDNGMEKINNSGLLNVLNTVALVQKKPVLGICLGMQLLTNGSEEGVLKGLGWINANTVRFCFSPGQSHFKVPHMSWSDVKVRRAHPLTKDLPPNSRFYFVHSYYVKCANEQDELMSCQYGLEYTCAVQHDNIMGVQFHPEKSHKFGMQLLKNFSQI